jgi:hypothetical protein
VPPLVPYIFTVEGRVPVYETFMQPVETAPGLALPSESTAELPEFDPIWTVPALNEFAGLVAVELRFDQVAALARIAHPARTAIVAATFTPIRPATRSLLRSLWSSGLPAACGAPEASPSGTPLAFLMRIRSA